MAYLGSLDQCVTTLEQCNHHLSSTTSALSTLTRTFPRVQTVIQCRKQFDLTTASDIDHAQSLISHEAVPFLFRQVDQLESAIEFIKTTHEKLEQQISEQAAEYTQLVADEASMTQLQQQLQAETAALAEEQTNVLNLKSLITAKERDIAELNKSRKSTQHSKILDEASKVDAEIIKMKRMLADIEQQIPSVASSQIGGDSDSYLVLAKLREQLALEHITADDSALDILDMLETKAFIPWWDAQSNVQMERMGSITRLLKYFYRDHGSTMQAIIDALLDVQSISIDKLRQQLATTGHGTQDLPLLIGHLKAIGAVTTESNMIQLDFSGLD
ncbi:hypothetical protein IWW40_000271 [Coemansia sp. RSA 1250]|nr:hypothetical protein IWW40_000271 [Coemansia sp. RSA 1250]